MRKKLTAIFLRAIQEGFSPLFSHLRETDLPPSVAPRFGPFLAPYLRVLIPLWGYPRSVGRPY